jgi:hypothetical protein
MTRHEDRRQPKPRPVRWRIAPARRWLRERTGGDAGQATPFAVLLINSGTTVDVVAVTGAGHHAPDRIAGSAGQPRTALRRRHLPDRAVWGAGRHNDLLPAGNAGRKPIRR